MNEREGGRVEREVNGETKMEGEVRETKRSGQVLFVRRKSDKYLQ